MADTTQHPSPDGPPRPTQRRLVMVGVVGMVIMLVIAAVAVIAAKFAFERPRPAGQGSTELREAPAPARR